MAKNSTGVQARKMAIGETIEFDNYIKTVCDTRFGEALIIKFVKDKTITRAVFAGGGLRDFLEQNKGVKSVTLVDQIADGEYTHNIYE